jgi:hypothetical protein
MATLAFATSSRLPIWPLVQFAAVGALVLTAMLIFRQAPRGACLVALQVNYGSGLLASWAGAWALVQIGDVSQLFHSIEVSLLVVAILSPLVVIGAVWIALFVAVPIVQILLWPPEIVQTLPAAQPWITFAFGLAALGILLYRRRNLRLQRALATSRAERLALEQLARMALLVRDLANTPMQTLTAGVSLLRSRNVTDPQILDSMQRALEKMRSLRGALTAFEQHIVWQPQDESFDGLERLEKMAAASTDRGQR